MTIGGYVLAGGAGSRMGEEKSGLRLGDRTLLQIAIEKLNAICGNAAVLCGSHPERADGQARAVCDRYPESGPLGGVATALTDTKYDWNLILAVDAPLIPEGLLRAWTSERPVTKAAMLSSDHGVEPFPLFIHRKAQSDLEHCLSEGKLRMITAMERCGFSVSPAALYIDNLSPLERNSQPNWFANANVPKDMKQIHEALGFIPSGQDS